MTLIDDFAGRFSFLSNFHPSRITWEGREWETVEHAYQAAKTLDEADVYKIWACPTPGQAKHLGQRVKLRPDWDVVKFEIMLSLLRLKFAIPELRDQLFATKGAKLVEGNTWHDKIWGVCVCARCGNKGENHLGRQLEQVRAEIT